MSNLSHRVGFQVAVTDIMSSVLTVPGQPELGSALEAHRSLVSMIDQIMLLVRYVT
jgi:hypothetical protein